MTAAMIKATLSLGSDYLTYSSTVQLLISYTLLSMSFVVAKLSHALFWLNAEGTMKERGARNGA